ncbi:MAG TPA: TonB-dependent receptor [Vicinamibacterales bacterium]|nr:TonB-dependent receptor [Vicinamibacterales bacterium]
MTRRYGTSRTRAAALSVLLLVALGGFAAPANAQNAASGSITGIVKDDSGGVLPGVTVEAASPALIEKTRTVITDAQGVYKVVDLRPGSYVVAFTLPGFNTYRREGVVLTTGFTATVNALMTVGALEETITVSGAAPQVDTTNVIQQKVISREVRDALPLPSNSGAYVMLIPGATQAAANQDVGGNMGENRQQFTVHGSRTNDFQQLRDGQFFGTLVAAGNFMSSVNPTTIEEVTILTGGGLTAESESGGAQINVIARAGGNVFNGSFLATFGSKSLQADNLDDALRARGANQSPEIKSSYELAGGAGGPIKRDKLWFFASGRRWLSQSYQPGNYFNKTQGTLFYTPDLDRPAYENNFYNETTGRLTWQAAQKHKIMGMFSSEYNCNCFFGIQAGTLAPEATGDDLYKPNWRTQVSWSNPATNKLLFEAGVTVVEGLIVRRLTGGSYDDISVLDLARNYRYNSAGSNITGFTQAWGPNASAFGQYNMRAVMSYVTGSHAFKSGLQFRRGHNEIDLSINHNLSYTFRGTVPQSVTYYAGPYQSAVTQHTIGAFTQDQWRIKRATLNLGLRFDMLEGAIPAVEMPAGDFVPARSFPAVPDALSWKDINPRVGVAYDVFGNGRTAVKAFVGRFAGFQSNSGLLAAQNPSAAMITSSTRAWSDANGDYIPQESELGPHSAATFGQVGRSTAYDDAITHGWHARDYSWQTSFSVQHELRDNLSVNLAYYRTWYGNFLATDNLAVTPADYDQYCITAPNDPRLPVAGQQVCGLYDLNPAKFGQTNNFVTKASNFGEQKEMFNGVDVTFNARLHGALLSGGVSTGRTVTDTCFVVDSPQAGLYQCHNEPPWGAGTQIKLSGVFALPWQIKASATYQNIASIPLLASYVASNAQIAPSLGRSLSACRASATCTATATVDLIPMNDVFREGRNTQVNLRLSRILHFGGLRVEPQLDVFNLLNANDVLVMNTRFGASWQNASSILAPRVFKLGAQISF